jgi:hypothetical protein
MARKSNRGGRGRGRGVVKSSIGKNVKTADPVISPVCETDVETEELRGETLGNKGDVEVDRVSQNSFPLQEGDEFEEEYDRLTHDGNFDVHSKGSDEIIEDVEEIEKIEEYEKIEEIDGPHLVEDSEGVPNANAEWRGLFKKEKSMGKLEYIAPTITGGQVFVSPLEEDVEEGIARWNSSLVGQFLDKALPFFLVKKSVQFMWKQFGEVEVFLVENGIFIFKFSDEAVCEEVLESKLWYVANKPLILRKWTPGMQLLKLTMSSIPIWVKLMNLPLEFWSTACLSCVASGVGKPLYADRVTSEQQRLGFARVLVEIDTKSVCPKEIHIRRANGTIITIGVEYPWLPQKCSGCGKFGHASYACDVSKKDKKIWVPKGKWLAVVTQPVHSQKAAKLIDRVIKRLDGGSMRKYPYAARLFPGVHRKSPEATWKSPSITRRSPGAGSSKGQKKRQGVRLSNSFEAFKNTGVEDEVVERVALRSPITFLEVFEHTLSSRDKGKRV